MASLARRRRPLVRTLLGFALLAATFALSGCVYILPLAGLSALFIGGSKSSGGVVVIGRDQNTSVLLSLGDRDSGDSTEGPGHTIVGAQIKLNASKNVTLRKLQFHNAGTGKAQTIPSLQLYIDAAGTGVISSQTAPLGLPTVFDSTGVVTFDALDFDLPQNQDVNLLVAYQTPQSAHDGDTFQLTLPTTDSVNAVTFDAAGSARLVTIFGTPLVCGTKKIGRTGSIKLFAGPSKIPNATVFPNAQNVPVLQLELRTSSSEDVQVTGLRIQTSGSGNDALDIEGADVYDDANGTGVLDLTTDRLIARGGVTTADNGDLVLPPFAESIPAASIVRWLVVYRMSGTARDGTNFSCSLTSGADFTAAGLASRQDVVATGGPIGTGATLTVKRAGLTVSSSSQNQARFAARGVPGVPALILQLTAGPAEPVVVTSLGIQASGTGNDNSEILAVRLYADSNGNGTIDSSDAILSGPVGYQEDNGQIFFAGFSQTVPAGGSVQWIVAYDIAQGAVPNHQFSCATTGAQDVACTGGVSGVSIKPSVSASGGTITVTGSLGIGPGQKPPHAQFPLANDPDVPVLQFRINAGSGEGLDLKKVTVFPFGTGDFVKDIASVDLILDADGSGTFSPGDTVLQSQTFVPTSPSLTFTDPVSLVPGGIAPGAQVNLLVRFQLSGQAALGNTFALTVSPTDVVTAGQLSHAPVVAGGAQVQSALITAERARLNLQTSTANPPQGQVLNGQPGYAMLAFTSISAPAEDVLVTSLTFQATGTADMTFDVLSADLYLEGAGGTLGVLDPSDVHIGSSQFFTAPNGSITFTGAPLFRQPATSAANLLLVFNMSSSARATLNLQASFTTAGGIIATGASSGLPSEIGGAASVPGNLQTIARGSLAVQNGPRSRSVGQVFPNATNLQMQQIQLTAGAAEGLHVQTVTVTTAGTADATPAVTRVRLLDDVTGDGSPVGKPFLASAVVAANGTVTFSPLGYAVPAGQAKLLLVVYDLSGTGTAGQTLRTRLADTASIAATGDLSHQQIVPAGPPVEGAQQTIVLGALTCATGAPQTGNVFANATNLAMLQVKLTAGPIESVTINSLKITHVGSGTPQTGVAAAQLWLDTNGNGQVDGQDAVVAQTSFLGAAATFLGGSSGLLSVPQGQSVFLLVVYQMDPTGSAAAGDTFQAEIAVNGDLIATGQTSGAAISASGAPLAGGVRTVVKASLGIATGNQNAPAGTVFQNQSSVPVAQITLNAGLAEAVRVKSVAITCAGTLPPNTGLAQLRLYQETPPADGVLNGDTQIGSVTTIPANGVVNFLLAPGALDVPGNGSATILVIADFAGPAAVPPGAAFMAKLAAPGDVVASGLLSGLAVSPTGATVTGGTKTATRASLTLASGDHPPADGTVFQTQTGVVLSQVRLTAGAAEPMRAQTLRFTSSGTLPPQSGISRVRLCLDSADTGAFNNAEVLLASAPGFTAAGDVTLSIAAGLLDIPASGSANLLLVCDFAATVTPGQTFRTSLAPADVGSIGLTSTLPIGAGGSTVVGATETVLSRSLDVTTTIPLPSTVAFDNAKGVRAAQLRLDASSVEGIRVQSLTLHGDPTQTGLDNGIVVKLYLDQNANGTVDATDVLLGSATYSSSPGVATIPLTGSLDIPASTSVFLIATYDLPGTAPAGATFRATIDAPDVQGVGLSSLVPAVVAGGPFPIQGPVTTTQTTTLAISAPVQVPPSSPFPDSTGVSLVRFTAAAGPLEGVRVTGLTFRPSAASTGDQTTATVSLWLDVNGDGTLEPGTDVLLAGPQAGTNGSISFTNASGLVDIPASATRQLLVVYDFTGKPTGGTTFDLGLAASDVASIGLGSSAPVVATGGPLQGGLKTIVTGQLSVALGASTPVARSILSNQANVEVLQATLTASAAEPVEVSQIVFTQLGTADAGAALTSATLYRDDNADGVLDGDFTLATASFVGGKATFAIAPGALDIPTSGSRNVLLVLTLNGTATNGQTFQAGIEAAADVTAHGLSSLTSVSPAGTPVNGNAKTVASATLALGAPAQVPAATPFTNAQGIPMVRLVATAGPAEAVRITSVKLTPSGTGDATALSVRLFLDANGDGVLDAGDVLLATRPGSNASVTFGAAPSLVDVPAGGSVQLLAVYDVVGTVNPGDTFALALAADPDLVAQGLTSGLAVAPTGAAPFVGGTQTIVGSQLSVSLGAATPLAGNVLADQTNVELVQVHVQASSSEAVRVSSIAFTALGTLSPGTAVASVALYRDDNHDGILDGDVAIGTGAFASGKATFAIAPGDLDIPASGSKDLLLVVNLNGTAAAGQTLHASVAAAADVHAVGLQSGLAVAPSGTPVTGNAKTVAAASLALAAPSPIPASNVFANARGVGVLRFTASAGSAEAVRISQVTLHTTGTGNPTLASARLYLDVNGNGLVDAGEAVLAGPQASGATLTFARAPTLVDVPASGTVQLIVAYDLVGGAIAPGNTFSVELDTGTDVVASGLVSSLAVAPSLAAPLVGGLQTVVGATLDVAAGASTPPASNVLSNQPNVVILQATLTAGPAEAVRVSSLSFSMTGTGAPAGIASAALYRDDNANGVLDGDTLLATVNAPSTTTLAFGGLAGTLDVPAGGSRSVLVVYSLAGTAAAGQTYGVSLAPAGVQASGLSSLLTVAANPFAIASAPKTVVQTTLTLAAPAQVAPGTVFSNAVNVPLARFTASAGPAEAVRISSVVLTSNGTGNAALESLSLYLDTNGNGVVDAGEPQLGTTQTGSTTGVIFFPAAGTADVPAGGTVSLVAVGTFSSPPTGATFALTASGVTAKGVSSGLTVSPTGGPFVGGTQTVVAGSLVASVGASTAPAGSVLSNQAGVPVLQATLAAGPAEAVRVSQLTVALAGTGAPSGLASVSLYRDDANNGLVGSNPLLGTLTNPVAGTFVFSGLAGSLDVPAGASRSVLVVYSFSGAATSGQTFGASIASGASIVATGLSSGLAVAPSAPGVTGNAKTVATASLTLSAPVQVPAASQFPNAANVSMVRFTATAGPAEPVRLTSVVVTPGGTGNVAQAAVSLFVDANGNGLADPTETKLDVTKPASAGGVTFSPVAGTADIPAGGSLQLVAVFNFSSATAGTSFNLSLSTVAARGLSSGLSVVPSGGPFTGGLQTITSGQLAVALGASTPAASTVLANQANVSVLQVKLSASASEPVRVSQLAFSVGGSTAKLASIDVYRDDNANGVLDGDTSLGSATIVGSRATVSIAAGALDVPPSSSRNVIVVFTWNGTALAGDTFNASIAANADVTAVGLSSGISLTPTGAPVTGTTRTVAVATLALTAPVQVPAGNQFANAANVALVRFKATAGAAEAVRISSVVLSAGGTGTPSQATVALYVDTNGNGVVDGTDRQLGAAQTGAASLAFNPAAGTLDVPAGGSLQLLAVATFSGATPATTFGLSLASLVAQGATSGLAVAPSGGGFAGGLQTIVAGALAVGPGPNVPPAGAVLTNQPNVEILQVSLRANASEAVRIGSLAFTLAGNVSEIADAKLYRDDNSDGVLNGDLFLGTAVLSGSVATVTIAPGQLDVPQSQTKNVLLVLDLNGTAPAGDTFSATLFSNTDVTATGLSSGLAVAASGAPVGGNTKTVGVATLALAAPAQVPAGKAFTSSTSVPALRFVATAGAADAVRVSQVTLRPTAAATGNLAHATVKLYLDANGDGVVDAGDVQVGTAQPDGASVVFNAAPSLVDIPAGRSVAFLATFDVSGGVAGEAFDLALASGADVVATGLTSAQPVSPTVSPAPPLAGGLQTITAASLTLGAAAQVPAATQVKNASGVAMVRFKATAGPAEPVAITSLAVRPVTWSTLAASPANVRLIVDANADGVLDAGDFQAGSTLAASSAGETFTGSPLALVPAGGSVSFIVVYDFLGTAATADAFDLSLDAASGLVAIGSSSSLPVTASGGTFQGGVQTIGVASLALGLGPNSPANGTVLPSQTNVVQAQYQLTAGAAEAVEVTRVRLTLTGTGSTSALSSVVLYRDDANGNLALDPVLGTATIAGGVATVNVPAGALDLAPRTSRNVLAVFGYSSAVVGQTYGETIAVAGDVQAIGLTSGLAVLPTGVPLAGATMTVVNPPSVAVSQVGDVTAGPIGPGETSVALLHLRLTETTGNGAATLTGLTVVASGTGRDQTDVSLVQLWRNNPPTTGSVGPEDVAIGATRYFVDNGAAAFAGLSETVPAGGTLDLLVTYDMASPAVGSTFATTVLAGGVSLVSAVGALPITPSGLPLAGPVKTVPAPGVTVAAGANDPTGTVNARAGATAIVVAQLALTTTVGGDVTLQQLTLQASGSGDDRRVASVALFLDPNGDGLLEAGKPQLARVAAPFATDNGSVTIGGIGALLARGTTTNLLVVYDLGSPLAANDTFTATLASASSVVVAAPATVSGAFPVSGRTIQVTGGLTLAPGPQNPAGGILTAFPANQTPVLELSLAADAAEDIAVNALTLTAQGTIDDSTAYTNASLWRSNGTTFNPATDTLLAQTGGSPFAADDGTVTFGGLAQTIAAGTTARWFVVLDVASPPAPGRTFRLGVARGPDVAATGAVTGSTAVAGASLFGPTFAAGADAAPFPTATPLALAAADTGSTVVGLVAADFNRDGKLDYALVTSAGNLEVWLGDGQGHFTQSGGVVWPLPVIGPLVAADLDRDGAPDLIVRSGTAFSVIRNDGTGQFGATPQTILTPGTIAGLAVVDFDRDGFPDVVVANTGAAQQLSGYRNAGNGTLLTTAQQLAVPEAAVGLVAADVDHDGIVDLVYASPGAPGHVRIARGDGTFFQLSSLSPVGGNVSALLAAELGRDGHPDLVVLDPGASGFFTLDDTSPGAIGFGSPALWNNPALPSLAAAVAGDWNGDGKLDLAFANPGASLQGVVTAEGDGALHLLAIAAQAGAAPFHFLAAGDFEGTGDPDLLAASATAPDTVTLLHADGQTSGGRADFAAPSILSWNVDARALAVGDLNGDGIPDLVTVGAPGTLAAWLGDGKGGFTKLADVALGVTPVRVALADLDRDGKLDAVVTVSGGTGADRLLVLRGNGDGTFAAPVSVLPGSPQPGLAAIALGEAARDGTVWAAVVLASSDAVQVFRNGGTMLADARAGDEYATGAGPIDVALSDVNHDGILDLVVLCKGSRTVEVRLGNGDGTFGAAVATALSAGLGTPSALAVGDVDQDGLPDVVVASADTPVVEVLQGLGPGAFASRGTFGATTAVQVALADTNKDGSLDVVLARGDTTGSIAVLPGATHPPSFAFGAPLVQPASGGVRLLGLALADLDGDGDLDVVAPTGDGRGAQVFLGR